MSNKKLVERLMQAETERDAALAKLAKVRKYVSKELTSKNRLDHDVSGRLRIEGFEDACRCFLAILDAGAKADAPAARTVSEAREKGRREGKLEGKT